MNNSIVNRCTAELLRRKDKFQQTRNTYEALETQMGQILTEQTKAEMEQVQTALDCLDKKRKVVMEGAEMKQLSNKSSETYTEIRDLLHELDQIKQEARELLEKADFPLQKKQDLWKQVIKGINAVIYSEDEQQAFEQLCHELQEMVRHHTPKSGRRIR